MGIFVVLVDPFNYFNYKISDSLLERKRNFAHTLNPVLWDTLQFAHDPTPYLVIGDSRAQRLSMSQFQERTGNPYKILAASGGKINEMADYFWFANARTKLKMVYIVLNFNTYTHYAYANRIIGAEATLYNPLLYIFDRDVLSISWTLAEQTMRKVHPPASSTPISKEAFWAWALQAWAPNQYGKWKYPASGYARLNEISAYCRTQGIGLAFIVPPQHFDYQRQVGVYGLLDKQEIFKTDLTRLATTYDFDLENKLTQNNDNFSDPVHMTPEIGKLIVDEILTGNMRHGLLRAPSSPAN